jgi:hypothetical protein
MKINEFWNEQPYRKKMYSEMREECRRSGVKTV